MGDYIRLRELTDSDLLLFKEWLYLPHVAAWYHDPLDWIEEVEKRNSEFHWIQHFIVEHEGKPIGFCQYYEYSNSGETWHGSTEISGTYSIDYMIGEAAYLGKGLGKAIIKALIDKIKKEEHAKLIIVQPEPQNSASCKTLLSCGFDYDGVNEIYIINL